MSPDPPLPCNSDMKPGSKVRFQVFEPALGRGCTWSVWTNACTGDVYVAQRQAGRWIKSSLHESGQHHYALTEAGREIEPDCDSSYLAVTHKHNEIAPGWIVAKRILVCASELRHHEDLPTSKHGFVMIPLHDEYNAVAVDILLGSPDAPSLEISDCYLCCPNAAWGRG